MVLGEVELPEWVASEGQSSDRGLILIPTGGSSGEVRLATHTWDTLSASVAGFCEYFGDRVFDCCCVLPLYHVSGLMQVLRSLLSGGRATVLPFSQLKARFAAGEFEIAWLDRDFLSLVPTQLQGLLDLGAGEWLASFKTVLLGGAPAWPELLVAARGLGIRLALTYGSTETASQVATLKPEAFAAGNNSNGQILPHAQVTIRGESGEILAAGNTGKIAIAASSLFLGYYPDYRLEQQVFYTDDRGWLDDRGYLYVTGRDSRKIIAGGENVFPEEVEAAILATGLVADVCVIGRRDRYWGEAVTAVYVPRSLGISEAEIAAGLQGKLSRYKHPKRWVCVPKLPRNAQEKVDLAAVAALVEAECCLGSQTRHR